VTRAIEVFGRSVARGETVRFRAVVEPATARKYSLWYRVPAHNSIQHGIGLLVNVVVDDGL
jgi:hypothetical protein